MGKPNILIFYTDQQKEELAAHCRSVDSPALEWLERIEHGIFF